MTTTNSRHLPIIDHPAVTSDTLIDYAVYLFWDEEPTGCYFLVPIHKGDLDDGPDAICDLYDLDLSIYDGVIPESIDEQKVDGAEQWTRWTELSVHDPIQMYIVREVFDIFRH